MLAKMKTNREKMMAKIDASHDRMMDRMDSQLETLDTCLGKAKNLDASPNETEFKAEHEEVPKK
jgi:hypothetical protein